MKISTWNINSIKARQDHVLQYISEISPDVLVLQELKGETFPADIFTDAGYRSIAAGQKAYNGVAVLSKVPPEVVNDTLAGDKNDTQARYLEIEVGGVRIINIYAPNGNPKDSDKFPYKLAWLDRLYTRAAAMRQKRIPFVITGDFNIIPEDKDCYDPAAWQDDALFSTEARMLWRKFLSIGLYDAFRLFNAAPGQYSFWDYQGGAFPANKGIRIDHFLLSPELADRARSCKINVTPRGWDRPSDHTPVELEIA